ncbi:MAG TPA: PilZ domain-containing protein [Pyrinomonadaceae bacterium]|jgi:hypothetical protein
MMQRPQESVNPVLLFQLGVERRSETRICTPFPVTVQGVDASGAAFQRQTIVDNISTSGLSVRLMQALEPGSPVYLTVQLATAHDAGEHSLWVSGYGVVRHVRPKEGGTFGYGIEFKHRCLVWQ